MPVIRSVATVALIAFVLLFVTCHGTSPSEPITCQPQFAGDWRWSLGSACGQFNSGISAAQLSTTTCAISLDLASAAQQATGIHLRLVADFSARTATLTKSGTACDTLDHGTITTAGARYVVTLVAPVKSGCCAGQYVVELTQ